MDGLLLSGHPLPHSIADGARLPACGTTRAMLALLQLDLKNMYLYYQPTAVPIDNCRCLVHSPASFKKSLSKEFAAALAGVMLLANTAVYFAKCEPPARRFISAGALIPCMRRRFRCSAVHNRKLKIP